MKFPFIALFWNRLFIHREGPAIIFDFFPQWIGRNVKSCNLQIWIYNPFHNCSTLNPIADFKGGWGRYTLQVICVRVVLEPVNYYCFYTSMFNKIPPHS